MRIFENLCLVNDNPQIVWIVKSFPFFMLGVLVSNSAWGCDDYIYLLQTKIFALLGVCMSSQERSKLFYRILPNTDYTCWTNHQCWLLLRRGMRKDQRNHHDRFAKSHLICHNAPIAKFLWHFGEEDLK